MSPVSPLTPSASRASDGAAPVDAAWMTTPTGAFVTSLTVPGAGQAALGLRRWVLYGLAEVGLWVVRLDALADERRYRDGYRDLAWDVARTPGGAERQDGGWGYYEAMSHYLSSGAYDLDPGAAGVQPETDPGTYNGVVWDLARGLYLGGGAGVPGTEEWDRALAYYEAHAAGPIFLWSWSGHEADLDRFRALIERKDEEARLAGQTLGLVLANHLVAAVDALIVARLRADDGARLRSGLDARGPAPRLRVTIELPTPY